MAVRGGVVKSVFDRVTFLAFLTLRTGVNLLPWRLAYVLGDVVTLAWWSVDTRHRHLALKNLEIAFPRWPHGRRRRLAFQNFRHICAVLIETLRYEKLLKGDWREHLILVGDENYERARAKGKGVMAISGHMGNWEWLSGHAFRFGTVNIVARAIHNPFLDREIRTRREKARVHQIYPTRESPREILNVLRAGESICFLVDQSAKGSEGEPVPFFGRDAPTHTGPALIAVRTGVPVIPVFTYRGKDSKIRLVYGKEMELASTGDRRRDITSNTALFTQTVEEAVRKRPEQWFWMHDRWRIARKRRKRRRR